MKQQRQQALLEIIQTEAIETQEGLLEALSIRGYVCTQATVSRDMKELFIVKTMEGGVCCYRVQAPRQETVSSLSQLFKEGVRSVVAAQNIVVVKTMPGLAMAVCTALDNMEVAGVVGTLAGDDTCVLIMTDLERATEFTEEMLRL